MKHRSLWSYFLIFLLLPTCGCKGLSKFAYCVGDFLDPDTCQCPADYPDCALCGRAPSTGMDFPPHAAGEFQNAMPPGFYAPNHAAGVQPHPPGVPMAHANGAPAYPGGQPSDPRWSDGQHSTMHQEIAARNAELIQARSDLSHVKDRVQEVHNNMLVWQEQMQDFQLQLAERDRQRNAAIDAVTNSLDAIVIEAANK